MRRQHVLNNDGGVNYPYMISFSTSAPTITRAGNYKNYWNNVTEQNIITSYTIPSGSMSIFYFTLHFSSDPVGSTCKYSTDELAVLTHTPCSYEVSLMIDDTEVSTSVSNYFLSMSYLPYIYRSGNYGGSINSNIQNNGTDILTSRQFPLKLPTNDAIYWQSANSSAITYTCFYIDSSYLTPVKFYIKPSTPGEYDLVFRLKTCDSNGLTPKAGIYSPYYLGTGRGPIWGCNQGGTTMLDTLSEDKLHLIVT